MGQPSWGRPRCCGRATAPWRLLLGALACLVVLVHNNASATAAAPPTATQRSPRPNIVWIVLDACRAQNLSCYGYARPTSPHLDQLAARGTLFEAHYTQGFSTILSVPSYMTGRYFPLPCLSGNEDWGGASLEPPPDEVLLPTILSQNGYRTLLVSAHFGIGPKSRLWRAFDAAVEVPMTAHGPSYVLPRFEELNIAAKRLIEEGPARPFFLYIHAMDTHFPYRVTPPYDTWLDKAYHGEAQNRLPGPGRLADYTFTSEDQAYLLGLYDGSIAYADAQIEALLAYLAEKGLADHTLVIVGSDHGEALAEDGKTVGHGVVYEEVMRTPLIMAGPGVPANARVKAITENTDIVPTLTAMLGVKTQARFDGKDLRPLFAHPEAEALGGRRFAFAKNLNAYAPYPTFVLRAPHSAYLYDVRSETGILLATPFGLTSIRPIKDPPVMTDLRARLMTQIMPLWLAYDVRLSQQKNATLRVPMDPGSPYLHTDPFSMHTDAELSLVDPQLLDILPPTWIWFTGALVGVPGILDELPPVRLCFAVPNGTYRVLVECYETPGQGSATPSAFRVQTQQDFAPRRVVCDTSQGAARTVEIGTYTVTNGMFHMILREADKLHPVIIGQIVFSPVGAASTTEDSPAERAQREEQMRALGYQW